MAITSWYLVGGSCGRVSGIIKVAGYSSWEFDSRPFWFWQRFIAEISGDNKIAEFFAKCSERIHPNLAIFLLMFIKLSLFSLFYSHVSTCSPLLTCNTRREGRANSAGLNFHGLRRIPCELGKAWTLARPSWRVLQGSSGEQVKACENKQSHAKVSNITNNITHIVFDILPIGLIIILQTDQNVVPTKKMKKHNTSR